MKTWDEWLAAFAVLILLACIAALPYLIVDFHRKAEACETRGGMMVKANGRWRCLDVREIVVMDRNE